MGGQWERSLRAVAQDPRRAKRPLPRSQGWVPTILRSGPYRIFFYSHESSEPAHVHVGRDRASAKFWLAPVALAYNSGYSTAVLRRVQRLIEAHEVELLEAWDAWFEP